jgi:predicted 3-demethylubiquinone-9 3-methyltransferase (glyoxalase superfamily)
MHFYSGLLAPAGIDAIARYDDSQPALAGTVQMARFRLAGRPFMALDGGPDHAFGFTEAVSLHVACATQAEVDALWPQLSAEPAAEQCGWLKDRFGLSWQIVPQRLAQLLDDPDPQRVQRVTQALLQMKKIDLATLEQAHAG